MCLFRNGMCVNVFFVCRVSHWEVFSSWCWWWWCVPAYGIVSAAVSLSSSSLLIRSNKQSGQHTAMKNKRFFSPSTKIAPALKLSRTNNTWITAASHHRPYEYILYLYRGRTQQVSVVFFSVQLWTIFFPSSFLCITVGGLPISIPPYVRFVGPVLSSSEILSTIAIRKEGPPNKTHYQATGLDRERVGGVNVVFFWPWFSGSTSKKIDRMLNWIGIECSNC